MKSISQELTDEIFIISRNLGYHTTNSPINVKKYPVVVINRADLQFDRTKMNIFGHFFVPVNIWSKTPKELGLITDDLMSRLMQPIELSNGTKARLDFNASIIRNLDELENNLHRNLLELEFRQI